MFKGSTCHIGALVILIKLNGFSTSLVPPLTIFTLFLLGFQLYCIVSLNIFLCCFDVYHFQIKYIHLELSIMVDLIAMDPTTMNHPSIFCYFSPIVDHLLHLNNHLSLFLSFCLKFYFFPSLSFNSYFK